MRLRGLARSTEETIWAANRDSVGEGLSPSARVVPQEVIATQHGRAVDLHGFGCSPCFAGIFWGAPFSCCIVAPVTTDPLCMELSTHGASTAATVR